MLNGILDRSDRVMLQSRLGTNPTYFLKPAELTEEEKRVVFEAVYFIGLSAFVQNPSKEMEEDIREHLFSEDVLAVVFSNKIDWRGVVVGDPRAIAFLGYRDMPYNGDNILYISGICVDPAYQGNRIGSALMTKAYKRGKYTITSLRTQNPVMKQSFDTIIGGHSYPNGAKIPEDIKEIGQFLADTHSVDNYDRNSMRCKRVYGSSLYGINPFSYNDEVTDVKFNSIDRDEGDALFCIKRV